MRRKITMKEAVELYGYSERQIYRIIKKHDITADKTSHTTVYDRDQLDEVLDLFVPPEPVDRNQVDWDQANCRGINTDMFYLEEDLLKNKKAEYRQLRNICFRCPIQRACLEVGFSHERYGFWGGLAALERQLVGRGKLESERLGPLKRDCKEFGVPFEEIVEASLVERVFDEVNY